MTVEEWLGENNDLGIDIWHKKYQYQNESFDEWLDRVSGGDKEVKQIISNKEFLFGGRILANRGLPQIDDNIKITYSNCYVINNPEDNLESIFDTAKKLARTYSYGGGCGTDLSKLAPKGAKVRNAAKESSGAVSFMDLYSMVTGLISQSGRRGALMLSLSCDHPDIEEFIDIKKDLDRVTKANISVRITDAFMNAVLENQDYDLTFRREETGEEIRKTVNARELMKKLAYNNWEMGEPGVLFWDKITNYNMLNTYEDFEYASVNPCAEEPLPAGGSCLLGSINLASFVNTDDQNNPFFDFQRLKEVTKIAVKGLNNVLDEGLPLHPLQEQRDNVRDWRQIGLGIFGLADALIKMEIKYGDFESLNLSDAIGNTIAKAALEASSSYGINFPKFNKEKTLNSSFAKAHNFDGETIYNSQLLTIAPTGTLSTMLGVSGGIEPIFANYYTRKTESLHGEDVYYRVYTPIVKEYMEQHHLKDDSKLPNYFITASSLDYHDRIDMQATWQKHIDASISSTVNLPNEATVDDVYQLYVYAWQKGLKGITIFRDGCKRMPILSTSTPKRGEAVEACDNLVGKKRKILTGCGSLHCTAFFNPCNGDLVETYLSKGSTGGCNNFMIGLSRMISLAARSGCSIDAIIDQLNSTGVCPSYAVRTATKHDTSKGSCCPMAVGFALKEMWEEFQEEMKFKGKIEIEENHTFNIDKCPTCGGELRRSGGCIECAECGWSKCDS